jgi:tetratricopeptide (TPR) repeat protein
MSVKRISLIIPSAFILCSYLPARNTETTPNFRVSIFHQRANCSLTGDESAIEQYNKGEVLLKKEDYTGALPFYEEAVKIDATFLPAWTRMGLCFYHTDQPDLAVEAYNKSLEIDSKNFTSLMGIPAVYESQKKYDAAIEAYQNILEIYPSYPEVYYARGRVYTYYKLDLKSGLIDMCRAYNLYTTMNSPSAQTAEKTIDYIYEKMKDNGQQDLFFKILSDSKYIFR